MFTDIYNILLFIGSMLIALNTLPQIYKIYKRKSAKDLSYISCFIYIFGLITVILYGLHNKVHEIWIPQVIQITNQFIMLILKIYYDSKHIDNDFEYFSNLEYDN